MDRRGGLTPPAPALSLSFAFVAGGLFGLLWGSFLNVVVYRLPQTDAAGLGARRGRTLAFLAWPPSFCPRCGAPIPPWRNVPLLSYLLMRGRAPCCGARVSILYPLGEALGAATVVWPLAHFGFGVDLALAWVFLSFLFVASAIDMQRRYLLPVLTMPLLWLGLLVNIDARFALLPDAVLGAAGGYMGLWALNVVFTFLLRKPAMGEGDFALMAALGAWLGWRDLPLLLFLASLLGVAGAALKFAYEKIARKRRRKFWSRYIGFGPCLSLAGALMLFYGDALLLAYLDFFARR